MDGVVGGVLVVAEDVLRVESYPKPARLVRISGRSFFEVLRRKLRWGQR